LSFAQAQLFPIRKENSRLSRENSGLHVERVREGEVRQEERQQHALAMRKLEGELRDLQLLLAAKDEALSQGEREVQKLKEVRAIRISSVLSIKRRCSGSYISQSQTLRWVPRRPLRRTIEALP
jgi:hypothetical protein